MNHPLHTRTPPLLNLNNRLPLHLLLRLNPPLHFHLEHPLALLHLNYPLYFHLERPILRLNHPLHFHLEHPLALLHLNYPLYFHLERPILRLNHPLHFHLEHPLALLRLNHPLLLLLLHLLILPFTVKKSHRLRKKCLLRILVRFGLGFLLIDEP